MQDNLNSVEALNQPLVDLFDPEAVMAALQPLLDLKYYLFPVTANKKNPPLVNFSTQSSNDPERILYWINKHPGCNWALHLSRSGLVAVDCDVKNGKNGVENFLNYATTYGGVPATWVAITPSGGRHFIFTNPFNMEIPCSVDKVIPGVDIRGENGYIIIYPSQIDGIPYVWEVGKEQHA